MEKIMIILTLIMFFIAYRAWAGTPVFLESDADTNDTVTIYGYKNSAPQDDIAFFQTVTGPTPHAWLNPSVQLGSGGFSLQSLLDSKFDNPSGTTSQYVRGDGSLNTFPAAGVPSTRTVAGHALSADVTISKSDVGLGNVDNTSDTNKPVSTAQAASIATKLTIPSGTTSQYVRGDASLATFPSIPIVQAYEGTTQRLGSFPIFKSATVGSGVAVVNLTADGTSGGTPLCTNGIIQDSVQVTVSDATASFQMAWLFSNSNKTITVTTNKLTTSNILTGILGQAAANGSVVKLLAYCY